uniref:Uncharacterized protein n=1 Tax=Physcomitrium patens TaxID=3218 RepID=A0A2K1KQI2_PHYPA|nr:hypothetical protein PHYPA_006926 [Physcomitrium patens]
MAKQSNTMKTSGRLVSWKPRKHTLVVFKVFLQKTTGGGGPGDGVCRWDLNFSANPSTGNFNERDLLPLWWCFPKNTDNSGSDHWTAEGTVLQKSRHKQSFYIRSEGSKGLRSPKSQHRTR